jgi:hypothetical protein
MVYSLKFVFETLRRGREVVRSWGHLPQFYVSERHVVFVGWTEMASPALLSMAPLRL